MDYELRIVVEQVASSSQEVLKRDTIPRYAPAVSDLHWRIRTALYRPDIPIRKITKSTCRTHQSHDGA